LSFVVEPVSGRFNFAFALPGPTEKRMIAKPLILASFTAVILSAAAATAAPCDSGQTGNMDIAIKAAQERERQQRALGLAAQAKAGGTTVLPLGFSPSASGEDRLSTLPPEGDTPSQIVSDQGCERPEKRP
jgi:hypothetical protein